MQQENVPGNVLERLVLASFYEVFLQGLGKAARGALVHHCPPSSRPKSHSRRVGSAGVSCQTENWILGRIYILPRLR